jgi:DNA-binding LacI/PurR family transcriptional regulator
MSGFTYGLQKADRRVEMSVLSLRPDEQVIDDAIRDILGGMDGPEMIIARDKMFARRAVEVARQVGVAIPDRIDVVIGNHHEFRVDGRPVPGGRCLETNRQCGQLLGRLLKSLRAKETITNYQVVLPVEFRR